MTYHSELLVKTYLYELKSQLDSIFDFGMERFTGMVIGPFFSVTHHCGYEMNRRITNEKHRAIGYVSRTENGTRIKCVRLAGMTNPLSLIGIFLFYEFFLVISDGGALAFTAPAITVGVVMTLFIALITAVSHSVTERGQEGSRILTAFLIDPVDYYSML